MSLDRFEYGIPDPQCANIVGWCRDCGGEVYEGDWYGENFGIHEECQEELDRIEEENEEDNDDQ